MNWIARARGHVAELRAVISRRGETSDGRKDECTELRECASARGKRSSSGLPFVTGDDFNPRIVTRLARFRVSSTCSRRSHVDQLAANQWLRFVFSRGYRNTDNGGLFECQ
jgi:hypothetical protein